MIPVGDSAFYLPGYSNYIRKCATNSEGTWIPYDYSKCRW